MGIRGTRDRSVGFVAVTVHQFVAVLAMGALAGCNSASQLTGLVVGGIAGGATANPAIGYAVGIGTDAATNAGLKWFGRSRQGAEQDAIAQAAGELPVGGSTNWKIEHTIPFGNEHGQLKVTRSIDSPLAACKEIVFSVDESSKKESKINWYVTDICKSVDSWKWASAEPAVERWGYLQ